MKGESGRVSGPRPAGGEDGKDDRNGADEMRRVAEEPALLGEALEDQSVLALVQVPEPAVDELRRAGRRARSEVALLDEGGAQPPTGGIEGDAGTGDPAADDDDIERLRRHSVQVCGPVKRQRRSHAKP